MELFPRSAWTFAAQKCVNFSCRWLLSPTLLAALGALRMVKQREAIPQQACGNSSRRPEKLQLENRQSHGDRLDYARASSRFVAGCFSSNWQR